MNFTKMQGLGNDYLYVYGETPADIKELSIALSDRHFGAGSDGMIYISPSEIADFKMRIFNADGSEAKMCGNGIRCVGKFVYDKGYTDKTQLKIETLSGIKQLKLNLLGKKVNSVTVDMGTVTVDKEATVLIGDTPYAYVPVCVGNPHAVVFVDDPENMPIETVGRQFQEHERFPDGINAEFARVLSDTRIRMRVFERGSGITMACGTGACATVSAAVAKGYCPKNTPVTVVLDGGELAITVTENNTVIMTGPAKTVYEGEVNL